jgi:hypothetical protein
MNKASFLLGSGFSVPAGYPTMAEMNAKLENIDASEIGVHTSREAWFLNRKADPNTSFTGKQERNFVHEFLLFYGQNVLKSAGSFHYETFYDYYISAYNTKTYSADLQNFLEGFLARHKVISDIHHLVMDFNDTFTQLLANLLTKRLKQTHLCKPYDPGYRNFLLLLEELGKQSTVHIHTLNHDLYMERLALSDAIERHIDDGFTELGSQYYAKKFDEFSTYMVRLRVFTDTYKERFCLYKLHGSIDNYWASFSEKSDLVKIPWGVFPSEIHKEVLQVGTLQYSQRSSNVVSDFLAGTLHKVSRYERGPYYPAVIKHFRTNLIESDILIVIGYGFADSRINSYLQKDFLADSEKQMFVVDITRPKDSYPDRANVHFIEGGVSEMNIDLICKYI